jgi:hypothetical protein
MLLDAFFSWKFLFAVLFSFLGFHWSFRYRVELLKEKSGIDPWLSPEPAPQRPVNQESFINALDWFRENDRRQAR